MTDAAFHVATDASRWPRLAGALGRTVRRIVIGRAARRALSEVPDDILKDVGLTRSDILFVADAVASQHGDLTRDALDEISGCAPVRDYLTRRAACSSARCPTG